MLPENNTRLVESGKYQVPLDGTHANEHVRKSSFTDATAYNVDRYPDGLNLTFAYGAGHPKEVIYYLQDNPNLLGRANPTDLSTGATSDIHTSYLKIPNLEMRFDKPVDISYQETDGHLEITGSAVMYPGMKPNIGDVFLTNTADGMIALMVVRAVRRLSISQSTYHAITYNLRSLVTPEIQENLDKRTVSVAYFDKTKYFTENYTLLKYDSYITLKELVQLRLELIHWYMDKYYDQIVQSIMHPDGYFDPYLVKYLQAKVSVKDYPRRAVQLFPNLYNYQKSIWYAMTEGKSRHTFFVEDKWRLVKYTPNYHATGITSLVGKYFVQLGSNSIPRIDTGLPFVEPIISKKDIPYGELSSDFYNEGINLDKGLEKYIRLTVFNDYVDPNEIYHFTKNFHLLEDNAGFYHGAYMLHLIDQGIYNIKK